MPRRNFCITERNDTTSPPRYMPDCGHEKDKQKARLHKADKPTTES